MLVDHTGTLIAFSGEHAEEEVMRVAAIASNIWRCHGTTAESLPNPGRLAFVHIALEKAQLGVCASSDYMVVCHASVTTPAGHLKARTQAVARQMQPALSQVTRS
eukprot:CAMPEP_0119416864 /NCGR_PEP_ID=MMETSP1335-20130426/14368_1 /TAXON_ID=259385 /ORGANISM="Chrysoculter rhomboideus, Strain RCC1486" /LENGTH=104 /DNA_ID=CAMNT_0007442009 /DNA_START=42 /DNA_END=356 /DNA_ORIENTATION=-